MAWRRPSKCDSGACVEVDFRQSSKCDSATCVQVGFKKSTYCDNGQCVQVGFHKSSRSFANGDCVEVQCQCHQDKVLIRDSKQSQLAEQVGGTYDILTFSAGDWRAFLADIPVRNRG